MTTLIQLDRQIIDVLVEAFKDNMRIRAMLRIPNKENLKALFSYCYHYTKHVGHVYYCKEENTAALYFQNSKAKSINFYSLWMLKLIIFSFSWTSLVSTIRKNRIIKKIRKKASTKFGDDDFLYVWFMGGKSPNGNMKGMLKVKESIIQESKKSKLPIYIETTIDRMVPIYENRGFEFYKTHKIGKTTIHFAKYNHHGK